MVEVDAFNHALKGRQVGEKERGGEVQGKRSAPPFESIAFFFFVFCFYRSARV